MADVGPETELRLALVCYGGVSLAVYMHGVTKELHKLVRASRAYDDAVATGTEDTNPFQVGENGHDTEHTYYAVLHELATGATSRRRRLSVSVDVVAGTSAGGINGVFLAKALACNGSQDSLRRLWVEEGDLRTLLHAWPVGGIKTRAVLAGVRLLANVRRPVSPLRGDRMSRLLYDAIEDSGARAQGSERPDLLRSGAPLELFVTATDLHGFEVVMPTGAGGPSNRERNHAQTVVFRTQARPDAFDADATGALAFAARATSCFPGAFKPVSLPSFARELGGDRRTRRFDPTDVAGRFGYAYGEHGATAEHAWFVDGGVLDNAPFDHVVRAIGDKPAELEVTRRIIYVQPDPGRPLDAPPPDAEPEDEAGWLQAVVTAVLGVKGQHAPLRDLEGIRELNTRIERVGEITRSQMPAVRDAISAALADNAADEATGATDGAAAPLDMAAVDRLADRLRTRTEQLVGLGQDTYVRLKVDALARRLGDEVAALLQHPDHSLRATHARDTLAAWAALRCTDTSALDVLLAHHDADVPYRERRLMFLLTGVNALYADALDDNPGSRADLDALKTAGWGMLVRLRADARETVAGLVADVTALFGDEALDGEALLGDPEAYAAQQSDAIGRLLRAYADGLSQRQRGSGQQLWDVFRTHTASWSREARHALLGRYLGFPLWDGLIFPTVALARLPQFTPLHVTQYSPLAAKALAPVALAGEKPKEPPAGKLRGMAVYRFAGFFDAAWRENDYLWGRLDAVELILRTLRAAAAGEPECIPANATEALTLAGPDSLRAALGQVLGSETELTRVADVRQALLAQVSGLG